MYDAGKSIEALRKDIRRHDYLYYVLSQPEISDKEYDDLLFKLKNLEDKNPHLKSDDSPTMRVSGAIQDGLSPVKHKVKMLSLENTYSFDGLREWGGRVRKGLGGPVSGVDYVVELKIDGVSASLTYKNGFFSIGATRGDGETGEDVTHNLKTIRTVPLRLLGEEIPELIEIRGEVYIDRGEFVKLNKEREDKGEELFVNPRNAASGSLKLLDPRLASRRRLNFFAHSLGWVKDFDFKSHWEFLNKLNGWGIRLNTHSKLCGGLDEVIAYCKFWEERRDSLTYDIDGVVVKVNSILQEKELGATLKSPRWAIAYKFAARQATTEVLKININVGRTGVITPACELRPVECAGVTISHATLHNFDEIKRLNVRVGDSVLIERAGDVIPKVVKVVKRAGKDDFRPPKNCPACLSPVVKEKEEDVAYRCINPFCPAQLERGVLHFASKSAMDIEGLGESAVSQLIRLKLISSFSDIYRLTKNDLRKLDLFKEKKIGNLLSAISRSKTRPLSRLIYALGIRHVGEKAAFVLAREFQSLDELVKARKEDLEKIPEVGPVIAGSIVSYFAQKQSRKVISSLKTQGLNFIEEPVSVGKTVFTGKTVVFTGELNDFSRRQAGELVRRLGGSVSSSVGCNTDFVVAGKNPGSKLQKAQKMGVNIIRENEFKEMLK